MTDDPRFIPVELRAPRGSSFVEIVWADGKVTHYDNDVLRGFCPSALWQGHQGPLRYIPGGQTELLHIEEVGSYGLRTTTPASTRTVSCGSWVRSRATRGTRSSGADAAHGGVKREFSVD
jgi:hypothetical protein